MTPPSRAVDKAAKNEAFHRGCLRLGTQGLCPCSGFAGIWVQHELGGYFGAAWQL